MGRYRSIIVHSMCLLLDGYYLQRAQFVFSGLKQQGWNNFAGEYAFLTQITHTLQTVFFAMLLVFDLFNLFIGGDRRRKRQRQSGGKKRDSAYYFNLVGDQAFSILFVFTAVVGVFFWSIYLYDQNLIMPASVEHLYPRDVNLFQHGIVMFIMLAELLTTHHRNISAFKENLLVLIAGTLYLAWTLVLVQVNGKWPYPFQNDMTFMHHAIFYAVSMVFMIAMVFVKRFLVNIWWHNAIAEAVENNNNAKQNKTPTTGRKKRAKVE